MLAGCGSSGDGGGETNGDRDAEIRRPPAVEDRWSIETIASGGVGLHVALAIGPSGPVAAYYATASREGEACFQAESTNPKLQMLWDLFLAERRGGAWQAETVVALPSEGSPPGLDLAIDPAGGAPVVAALGGVPIETQPFHFCGGNDLALYRRQGDGWSPETLVSTSGEAASGEPGSDAGEVVGYWPALAFDGQGRASVAYRDVHYAILQSDDFARADLELVLGSGGAWRAVPVDVGRGAGEYNSLAFDQQGRPVIAYYQPEARSGSEQGVWVARSPDGGASWRSTGKRGASTSSITTRSGACPHWLRC